MAGTAVANPASLRAVLRQPLQRLPQDDRDRDASESRRLDPQHVSRRPVVALALLCAGLLIASVGGFERVGPWIILAIAGPLIFAFGWVASRAAGVQVVSARRGRMATAGAAVAVVSLAVAWGVLRDHRIDANSISALVGPTEELWRLEGRVATAPVVKTPGCGGSMARYGFQSPITVFQLAVEQAIGHDGEGVPIHGRILVRLGGPEHRLAVGDRLRALGMASTFPPAMNPGDMDRARIARTQGLAGVFDVATLDNAELLETNAAADGWLWRLRRWQGALRARASGWIRQDLPRVGETRREALLASLLLGEREPGLDGLDDSFTRVGLAHLLAISGLHLAILAGTAMLFLRLFNLPPNVERVLVILLIVGYLAIVPAKIPVWRSGVMLLTFLLAGMTGRRVDAVNVWAVSGIVLLLWRPCELFAPGTQLSFGVVLALITLTRPMRLKLFGEARDEETISWPEIVVERGKTSVAANLMAWLVSTPLVAFHFGAICPLAAPASIVALPLSAVILGAGYLKAMTAALFPSVGVTLGPLLALCTDGLIVLVDHLDRMPLASIDVGHPGLIWTVLATAGVVWWIRATPAMGRWRGAKGMRLAATFVLAAWLLRHHAPRLPAWLRGGETARVVMLAVGDGSCYVVQAGGETVLFDAGSGSYAGIGDASIVPTLRRLAVLDVPTLIVSHADVDHFAAALEVMEAMKTRRLVVTSAMVGQARRDPLGPAAFLLAESERMGVQLIANDAGAAMVLGDEGGNDARLVWLHPPTGWNHGIDNEASSVIRLEVNGRRMLFTGDVQSAGLVRLMTELSPNELRADAMELPHHGSWSDLAVAFVAAVNPQVVLQSTGPSRLRADRWTQALAGRQRFVTAADGMTIVRIDPEGSIETTSYRDGMRLDD